MTFDLAKGKVSHVLEAIFYMGTGVNLIRKDALLTINILSIGSFRASPTFEGNLTYKLDPIIRLYVDLTDHPVSFPLLEWHRQENLEKS